MTHCSHCSAENSEGSKFCASCGERMEPEAAAFPAMRGMVPLEAAPSPASFAAMRGMAPAPLPDGPHGVMRDPHFAPADPALARYAQGRSIFLATLLAFILPGFGLGQFYNGDTRKGVTVAVIALLASFITIYLTPVLGVPLALANVAFCIYDARKVARREKGLW